MPFRQSHPPSTSDGLLGGAFVVIGFVALILIAAVDVISSRWPPSTPSSDDTAQDKPGSPVTRQEKDNTPNFVKDPIKEPNPLSDVKPSEITEPGSHFIPTDREVQPQENQLSSYPLIPDLDDNDLARVEESRTEVPLEQDQGLRQEDSHTTADIHEITVPGTNDSSSQEWVSLSKPEADLESLPLAESKLDFVYPDSVPTASFVHVVDQGSSTSPEQKGPAGELSSSTLLDAPPTNLYDSITTIGSDTSRPLSTPEPDTTHSFDPNAAAATMTTAEGVVVHIQTTDEEKQVPLNPKSSLDFGSLKPRTSTRSLHHSTSTNSINRRASGEHLSASAAMKKKRGSSFIKKSGTLINKVFKNNKEASGGGNANNTDDDDSRRRRLSSSFDTLDHHHHSTTGLGHDPSVERKLTSPSRVSLGSIRSISGSIKKRMGRSSSNATDTIATTPTIPAAAAAAASKVAIITSGPAQDVEVESHDHPEHPDSIIPSDSSQQLADDTSSEPSLLKTMFKVRKPSK